MTLLTHRWPPADIGYDRAPGTISNPKTIRSPMMGARVMPCIIHFKISNVKYILEFLSLVREWPCLRRLKCARLTSLMDINNSSDRPGAVRAGFPRA